MVQSVNLQAIQTLFTIIKRPSLLLPTITIPNITQLPIDHLHSLNITTLLIDKDNTLTLPYESTIFPPFAETFKRLKNEFRVVIVSNSAGSIDDLNNIQANQLQESLGVTIHCSALKKPLGGKELLEKYNVNSKEIAVIGDRLLTDIVFGNLIQCKTIWCSSEISTKNDNRVAIACRKMEQLGMKLYSFIKQ
jgi:phosphatidylglycerophosphatase GEP4